MMLLYKAWRESRIRFALIAVVVAAFCIAVVCLPSVVRALRAAQGAVSYNEYIYRVVYAGTAKGLFATLMIFLGLGGLARERALGTACFTLVLPVSRKRLILTQLAVGSLEVAVLALIPAALISFLSPLVHESYPVAQALHFSVLWFVVGMFIYATTFLLGVVLTGEFAAPAVAFILLYLQALVTTRAPLVPYRLNLMWTMGEFGTMYPNAEHTVLASGPLPWARLVVLGAMVAAMCATAVSVTKRADY